MVYANGKQQARPTLSILPAYAYSDCHPKKAPLAPYLQIFRIPFLTRVLTEPTLIPIPIPNPFLSHPTSSQNTNKHYTQCKRNNILLEHKNTKVNQMLIQPNIPVAPTKTTVVINPAPTLSACVAGLIGSKVVLLPLPAALFPILVPPVLFVTGPFTFATRLTKIADMAAICCPTPDVPSQDPLDQLKPHVRPLEPPVHCAAAAMADALRRCMMAGLVYGAILVVPASHLVRKALKLNMSVVHLRLASHATSYAISFGKKVLKVAFNNPSTRPFQISLPLV